MIETKQTFGRFPAIFEKSFEPSANLHVFHYGKLVAAFQEQLLLDKPFFNAKLKKQSEIYFFQKKTYTRMTKKTLSF